MDEIENMGFKYIENEPFRGNCYQLGNIFYIPRYDRIMVSYGEFSNIVKNVYSLSDINKFLTAIKLLEEI